MRLTSYPGFRMQWQHVWTCWRHHTRWHKIVSLQPLGLRAHNSRQGLNLLRQALSKVVTRGAYIIWRGKAARTKAVDRQHTDAGSKKRRRSKKYCNKLEGRDPVTLEELKPSPDLGDAIDIRFGRAPIERCWRIWSRCKAHNRFDSTPTWSEDDGVALHEMNVQASKPRGHTGISLHDAGSPTQLRFGAYHIGQCSNMPSPLIGYYPPLETTTSVPCALLTTLWADMSEHERSLALSREIQRASWILLVARAAFLSSIRDASHVINQVKSRNLPQDTPLHWRIRQWNARARLEHNLLAAHAASDALEHMVIVTQWVPSSTIWFPGFCTTVVAQEQMYKWKGLTSRLLAVRAIRRTYAIKALIPMLNCESKQTQFRQCNSGFVPPLPRAPGTKRPRVILATKRRNGK